MLRALLSAQPSERAAVNTAQCSQHGTGIAEKQYMEREK